MVRAVVPVSRLRGQVDAADECHLVVDHDGLLVVTVQRPFLGIERALDPGVCGQLPLHVAHLAARRPEQWERRACPGEHSHVDPFGELGEQVSQDGQAAVTLEGDARREVPAREMDVRSRLPELAGDARERCRAVDQDLQAVSVMHLRAFRPPTCGRIERVFPADASQPPAVVPADLCGELGAGPLRERRHLLPRSCGSALRRARRLRTRAAPRRRRREATTRRRRCRASRAPHRARSPGSPGSRTPP